MIEKVVIGDTFKSDLFTQLLGEEMIFQRILDLTNLKQEYVDVQGGIGQLFSILKELEQSDSEQSNSGEESNDETTRKLLPLVSRDWSPSQIWYKKNDKRFNKCAFIRREEREFYEKNERDSRTL